MLVWILGDTTDVGGFSVPTDNIIQYGSFGLVVFVVVFMLVWFVRTGFPRTLDTVSSMVDRVLIKIDEIEEECRKERGELMKTFREERDTDRKMRHDLVNQFTAELAKLYNAMSRQQRNSKTPTKGDENE